ncbi:MAG: hypothetical protein IPM74_15670 [Crocinitomicaceae bacterium]|nr:hypothetical protein [Crocinitomicaceae bacterium]
MCETIANLIKTVVVAGLDMDYLGRPYGSMPHLISIADGKSSN